MACTVLLPQITGNPDGYFARLPTLNVSILNNTAVLVSSLPLPDYAVASPEGLLLFTSVRELYAGQYTARLFANQSGLDDPRLIGSFTVLYNAPSNNPATIGVVVGVVVSGVSQGSAAEFQGVGALALLGCADPITGTHFAHYRILSLVSVLIVRLQSLDL